jgi:hypothetical protein
MADKLSLNFEDVLENTVFESTALEDRSRKTLSSLEKFYVNVANFHELQFIYFSKPTTKGDKRRSNTVKHQQRSTNTKATRAADKGSEKENEARTDTNDLNDVSASVFVCVSR